ncbi:hypothetical protein MLD38_016795 [Melastoma candidum]|uniref:Uncharacterized protein n=1 Tax=Melastoma candidum TaxID=119954 RepID=A0ACB9QRN5_9MYRT|nr:hypothetical protein MLD38_016795 [Melastoma candidum]
MAAPHVARLVPLIETLDNGPSDRAIDLTQGPNLLGRDVVSVPDKRLSRKHLTLTVPSLDGSASLFVEGSNPVVVKSGKERRKIRSGESTEIKDGDILELIPGHHFFRYQAMGRNEDNNENTAASASGGASDDVPCHNGKRSRRHDEDCFPEKKGRDGGNNSEFIRHFNVSKQMLPMTFRLLRVQGLPQWANTASVSIADVIQGDIRVAILSNYMVDIDWLITACPSLASIPHVLVIHGEGDGTLDHMKRKKPPNWILHKPPLPIAYGTHHSKAMLLVYPRGVRIIVHTANLIFVDWNNKSQGLWMQDFPWKDQNSPGKGSEFETDLVDYLSALKWPEFNVNLPAHGNRTLNPSFFKKFNYQDAAVRLIASVPGYHLGKNLNKWGHMKLRSTLQQYAFGKEFMKSPLVYQFSSLGSLDEKWMAELATSMSAGFAEEKLPLGLGVPMIIWPSVENVRCSLEGYAAGNAIPSPLKNVEKEFLKKYWAKWKAGHTGRCRAMPHIKTFTRYNGQHLAWLLLTSANLSKAAWGALQKNNSQLMIRSYELGVLFLPSVTQLPGKTFSCTEDLPKHEHASTEKSEVLRTRLVTLAWQRNEEAEPSSEYIPLPVPYELPPKPYSTEDIPWSWDRRYSKKDVYGQVWPRSVQLYTCQDS